MRTTTLPVAGRTETPPQAARPRGVFLIFLAVFAGGGLVSLQVFVNGRLAHSLGSAELAGSVNHVTGLLALVLAGVAAGVPARAARRLKAGPRPRWWQLLAGLNGALFIIVAAYAAPKVGVALLTVAFISGQTTGSLVADRAGISPAGVKPLSAFRLLGVAVALVAVALAAVGARGEPRFGLLALAVLAGAGVAVQQAAMGHTAKATGEPLAAGAINFASGAIVIVAVTLVVTRGSAPHGWSAPPWEWIGGLLGAVVVVVLANAVSRLGVLRTMLALVAGQSAGGLLLDSVSPPPGEAVTVITIVSVVLTLAAVVISGVTRAPRPRFARTRN
jgi:transporter family-2 protein